MGQAGVEASYDRYLRGTDGSAEVTVDSLGRPTGPVETSGPAAAGQHAAAHARHRPAEGGRGARCASGIKLAHTTSDGTYADGGAIVALDPRERRDLAMASSPTYAPSVFVSRDPTKLAPLVEPEGRRRAANFPGAQPRDRRRLPARVGLEAGHRARGDGGEHPLADPDAPVHAELHASTSRRSPTGIPYVEPADGAPPGARGVVRHLLLPGRREVLQPARRPRPDAPGLGLALRLRRRRPGSTSAPSQPGSCRRPTGAAAPTAARRATATSTGSGSRATRSSSRSARATCRDAAADGALLRDDRERRPARDAAPRRGRRDAEQRRRRSRRSCATSPRSSRPRAGSARRRCRRCSEGLYAGTHSPLGTSYGVFGQFPVAIAGKTGTAQKLIDIPGFPNPLELNQSWWCGYGPYDSPTIVVCAVIENGGHGGTAAAPAALQVFEAYFHKRAIVTSHISD